MSESQLAELVKLAETELYEYSSKARKIEKLRRKFNFTLSKPQRQLVQAELLAQIQPNSINKLVAEQRQAVALPFWGIGGLGLLLAISMNEPLGLLAAAAGVGGAIALQKWGYTLQAKVLLLETFAEMDRLSGSN